MVEEPATDGDSDHTDSEATVDSKNTCELAVTRFFVLLIINIFNAIHVHADLKMWEGA